MASNMLSNSEQQHEQGHIEPAQGSSQERPTPGIASAWRAMNAEDLGIFWCRERYGCDEIFEKARVQHVENGCGIAGWGNLDKLVSLYTKYMDNVFRVSPADVREMNLIMTHTGSECAKDADLLLIRRICNKLKENIRQLALPETSRICATQMMMAPPSPSTDFKACKLLIDTRLNPATIIFLQRFEAILLRFLKGKKPSEINYQALFTEFARIFIITFCPGDMQQMDIFGEKVTSTPDLRYVKCKDQDVVVATIAKVKKMPKTAGGPPEKRQRQIDNEDTSDDDDEDEDSFLSDKLRGRHAAELLLGVTESILPMHEKKRHVLGLIIRGTKVCLTCLEIDEDHLKQLQEPAYRELKDKTAVIYHTRSYDMFIKEDRHHLIKILLTLVKLADNRYLMHLLYPQEKR